MSEKRISKDQFQHYFGKLQEWLRDGRKYEDGYYLTDVSIEDVPKNNQIEVSFVVEYGPVGYEHAYDYPEAVMNSFGLAIAYNKAGKFQGYSGDEEANVGNGYLEGMFTLPSVEDFLDPEEDDLFNIIRDIISMCGECGHPLSRISFGTYSPEYSGEFVPGYVGRGEDCGEGPRFIGSCEGICLKQEMKEDFNYSYSLKKNPSVKGEYILTFTVSKR